MNDERLELQPGTYRAHGTGRMVNGVAEVEVELDEGPWGVYDCYCMKCSKRYIGVAPVSAEDTELWECSCGAWAVQWHPHEDDGE